MPHNKQDLDIFGTFLTDFHHGEPAQYQIRRDDGYVETNEAGQYFQDYSSGSKSEQLMIDRAGGSVLDMGAGAGQHSMCLQDRGFEVCPIDISPGAVKVMQERGLSGAVMMDMFDLNLRPKQFDTILLMFNGLGLAGDPRKALIMLDYWFTFTAPGGRLLMTLLNPYDTNKPEHLRYHYKNQQRKKPGGQLKIRLEYKQLVGNWFDLLLVSPAELKMMTEKTRWKELELILVPESRLYGAALHKSAREGQR